MTKTIFIFFLTIVTCFNSSGQKDISDSLFSVRWNNFMCDSLFESFFTWDSSPICVNGFDDLTTKLNSSLDFSKKIHGEIVVSFFINCKGEIDFIRFAPSKKGKRCYALLRDGGKLTAELFAKCGTWEPAMINGSNIDSEHELTLSFKNGKLTSIKNYYEK